MTWTPNNNEFFCSSGNCASSTLTFLSLLSQYFGSSYDDVFKYSTIDDGSDTFDFVIVGAGTAGCVVANRLSENKDWKVLLLEGGGEEPLVSDAPGLLSLLQRSSIDYDYETQPEPHACASQPNKVCRWPRGRVMGGSSVLYSMHFTRGNQWDYDNWSNIGNTGWSWNDVLPYFKKSEDLRIPEIFKTSSKNHGIGGYQTIEGAEYYDKNAQVIMKGWKELGLREIDYNSGDNYGTSRVQYATVRGARQSSNSAFIRPIRGRRPNLTIRPNSWVTKIIIDPKTNEALGVEYRGTDSKTKLAYAKKEVVISGGSIDSPKLLMLSGIGPADSLKKANVRLIKDLPVGQNLQTHFAMSTIDVSMPNKTQPLTLDTLLEDVINWSSTREGPMSVNSFMENVAFLKTSFEKVPNLPDIQVGYIKYKYYQTSNSVIHHVPYYDGFFLTSLYLAPKSRGYLVLNTTKPYGPPVIYANYFTNPEDIKAITEGARLTNRLVETKAFQKAGFTATKISAPLCDYLEYDTLPYYECLAKNYTGIIHHQVSTCKMGPKSDPGAVVDPRLRVHGIRRLRVIDASIMPILPRGNTLTPTLMIAEKGSDMIKEDWSIHHPTSRFHDIIDKKFHGFPNRFHN